MQIVYIKIRRKDYEDINNIRYTWSGKNVYISHGHYHIGFIKEENGRIFANPGSISLPKNNTEHSYIIFEKDKIILKNIEGKIIKEKML